MCGRFRLTRAAKLAEQFAIDPDDDWVPRYNIAPAQNIPVIRQHPEEPRRFGSNMRWGLIPFWAKDASIGYKMINARAETVASKPAFREALKKRRCLIPGGRILRVGEEWEDENPVLFHHGRRIDLRVRGNLGAVEESRREDG